MYAALEFYKIFIPLRDKIETGADSMKTITSLFCESCSDSCRQRGNLGVLEERKESLLIMYTPGKEN